MIKLNTSDFRVLKYIEKNEVTTIGDIKSKFFGSNFNSSEVLDSLKSRGLITIIEINIKLTDLYKNYIQNLETDETALMHKTIFNDYDFTLIQFLFNRGYSIHLDDFPNLLVTHAPQYRTLINNGNIYQSLYRLSKLISEKNNCYYLNDSGKTYYINAVKYKEEEKQKVYKKIAPMIVQNAKGSINNGTITGNQEHYSIIGDSTIAGRDVIKENTHITLASPKEKWWKKLITDFISNLGKIIATALISFISVIGIGKSCHQDSKQKNIQQEKQTKKLDSLQKDIIK